MKKTLVILGLVFVLFSVSFILASGDHEETFEIAEELIKQKISCEDLTDDQLEILGDYYMEQMHPGEAHEVMDKQMGGEGSESLRLMHIRMGEAFYCGEHGMMSGEMMDMMMGRGMMGFGSSGIGMMSGMGNMMGNSYYGNSITGFGIFGVIIIILVIIILVLLIILLIKQLQKPKRRLKRK